MQVRAAFHAILQIPKMALSRRIPSMEKVGVENAIVLNWLWSRVKIARFLPLISSREIGVELGRKLDWMSCESRGKNIEQSNWNPCWQGRGKGSTLKWCLSFPFIRHEIYWQQRAWIHRKAMNNGQDRRCKTELRNKRRGNGREIREERWRSDRIHD